MDRAAPVIWGMLLIAVTAPFALLFGMFGVAGLTAPLHAHIPIPRWLFVTIGLGGAAAGLLAMRKGGGLILEGRGALPDAVTQTRRLALGALVALVPLHAWFIQPSYAFHRYEPGLSGPALASAAFSAAALVGVRLVAVRAAPYADGRAFGLMALAASLGLLGAVAWRTADGWDIAYAPARLLGCLAGLAGAGTVLALWRRRAP